MRIISSFCILIAFQTMHAQPQLSSVSVDTIYQDTTLNCRALEIFQDEVFLASSDGRILRFNIKENSIEALWEKDTIHQPNFRSLAVTGEGVFALSIGSPAILYKNGKVVYSEDHEKAFYDSMEFWNDQEGIAMGDPTDNCISIITTRNGGESWEKIPCSELPKSTDGEAAFAASDTNIKIIGDNTWIATGGVASRILLSKDKGESWTIFDTPIIQGSPTTGMYSIDFFNEKLGFAIGGDYTKPERSSKNKIKTVNGGRNWQVISDDESPGYRSCIQFVPDSGGKRLVAIGFKGIDVSNDGGISWTHLSDEGFYTLRFLNSNTAFATGTNRLCKLTFE